MDRDEVLGLLREHKATLAQRFGVVELAWFGSFAHDRNTDDRDGMHHRARAWIALTVGSCTDLVQITEPDTKGFVPIAESGGLSPFSTTSLTWERHWPLKPDVVGVRAEETGWQTR